MKKLLAAVTVLAVSTAQADTIYVDANCPGPGNGSEAEPYCSIQTAIDNAVDTDEVVVAPGTYFETIDFLGGAITLRSSDGPDVTTIDGTGFLHVVQCVNGEGPDTVLDGFTITGGNADAEYPDGVGGGLYCTNGSGPVVTSCTFIGNSARKLGGGAGIYGSAALRISPEFRDCLFTGNQVTGPDSFAVGGGGLAGIAMDGVVINCTFTSNTVTADYFATGGALAVDGSPMVIDCRFHANVAMSSGGAVTTQATHGPGEPQFVNCTFTGNRAGDAGGGVFSSTYDSMPTLINCTLAGNAAGEAGAVDTYLSSPALINCVLWSNGPDQVHDGTNSATTLVYTNVQGGWPGTGNIDADPLFVDPDNGDFRLSAGSPCIDAGHNNAISDLTDTDLDGNPRFADDPNTTDTGCGELATVDMGAYEYQGVPAEVVFADLNGDGFVGIADLMILNGCMGSDDSDCCLADLDTDGEVGMSDRMLLIHKLYHASL